MTDLRKAAEMALEALDSYPLPFQATAKEALRQALAQPETSHPEKQDNWVGLTDEEFMAIAQKYSLPTRVGLEYFKDELEAKLKEKNT